MTQKPSTIDAYVAALPPHAQAAAQDLHQTIRAILPDAEERISYGIPAFRLYDRNVIYFGAWKQHLGVYPIYQGNDELERVVGPFRSGKDSLHFPYDAPLPKRVIARAISAQIEKLSPR